MVSVSTHNSVKPESSRQKLGCSLIEAQGPIIRCPLSLPPDFHQTAITVLLDRQSTQKKWEFRNFSGRIGRDQLPFLPPVILSERSSPSRVRCAAPEQRRALDCCGPL